MVIKPNTTLNDSSRAGTEQKPSDEKKQQDPPDYLLLLYQEKDMLKKKKISARQLKKHMMKILDDWENETVLLAEYASTLGMLQPMVKHFGRRVQKMLANTTFEAD